MTKAPYTPEEDNIIKDMHGAGYGPEEIAVVLKSRNAGAIKDHGYTLGIKWMRTPEIDMDAFKRMMKGRG